MVDYAEKLASTLWHQMKKDFTSRLQKSLEKMKWPQKDLVLTNDVVAEWADSVRLLLSLQEPYAPCLPLHSVHELTSEKQGTRTEEHIYWEV